MSTHIEYLDITAPVLPVNWAPSASTSKLNPPITRTLLPAGQSYLAHVRRVEHKISFAEYDLREASERERREAENGANGGGEDDLGVGSEEETDEILTLDPKEWKKQDNYAVLGLSHLRYLATPEQIKIAHRKKVLRHHPDKKASSTHSANDDAFFKCIAKAHEVLTNSERRRQYDSVDHAFLEVVDDVPTASQFKDKTLLTPAHASAFFKGFGPVFEREARFSKTQPVPLLGSLNDPKEKVEAFYDFWYNFESWRSFEWLDKEVNEGSDSRDDKRYTEKKNKSERARRKKEDTARVRSIVDLTLSLDPRIKRIKQEEKDAREAKKRGLKPGAPPPKTPAELAAERKAAEDARIAAEEADKIAKAEAKKAKAAAANAAKKARRQQRAAEEGG
jgi:DnaJ family protein C protein 2